MTGHDALHIANTIAKVGQHVFEVIIPYIAASGVISTLMVAPYKYIKRWFEHHKTIMILLIGVVSLVVANVVYVFRTPSSDPGIAQLQGLTIAFVTQPIYLIVIKPLGEALRRRLLASAALEAEVKSATAPLNTPQ